MHIPHRASMDATDHSYPAPQRPALPAAPTSIRLRTRLPKALRLEKSLLSSGPCKDYVATTSSSLRSSRKHSNDREESSPTSLDRAQTREKNYVPSDPIDIWRFTDPGSTTDHPSG
eukprot:scaffold38271_cov29-Tisochrysis_lutea.AAC.1